MKTANFLLNNPSYKSETSEYGFEKSHAIFKVPILPAYAILNHTIQGVKSNLDGQTTSIESAIVDDTVIVYNVSDFSLRLSPDQPILVVNYLGITDYQNFFPQFKGMSLHERAGLFMEEADKAFDESAWLAFAMMAGAVFESLLYDMVDAEWGSLGPLIEKTEKKGIFDRMEISALQDANAARNLVHANRFKDEYITRKVAMNIRVVLEQFLRYNWTEIKRDYHS